VTRFARHRDYYAGALMALIGAGAIIEGRSYGIGTLTNMGSGFFPVALGAGLILMGVFMAAIHSPAPDTQHPGTPDWRGTLAITAAVALFIALAQPAGLVPATFACVSVGALGTRATTLKEAALLALGVTVFGVLLFSFGLKVQFPIITGVWQ
jgi:hypothetical protein